VQLNVSYHYETHANFVSVSSNTADIDESNNKIEIYYKNSENKKEKQENELLWGLTNNKTVARLVE